LWRCHSVNSFTKPPNRQDAKIAKENEETRRYA
jgi:hypothetical protein